MSARRVAVVDDDPDVRMMLRLAVERDERLEWVAEAADAAGAVRACVEAQPDVIVLDNRMPDRPGLEILPVLHAEIPAARIVFYTAYDSDRNRALAAAGGAEAFLLKPTSVTALVEVLAAA